MEANPVRIIQYFDGEKQSLIPLFQREYTWIKKNWQSLWDDVLTHYSLGPDSSHFMGALVSIPARTVPVGVTKHLIIDGQQRLTTIAVLLCALRDVLEGRPQDRVQDFLVNRHCEGTADYLKLLPTQSDREAYFRMVVDKEVDPNHLLGQAYSFFKDVLMGFDDDGNMIDPALVLDTVARCLQVVMINLGEADDPYLIFESLNYKGVPLTQADLVRNYVLMKYKHALGAGGEQERIYRQYWQPLERAAGEDLSEFLRYYGSMNGQNVKKPQVYATIKASVAGVTAELMEAKLSHMRDIASQYQKLIDPGIEADSNVRSRLRSLVDIEVSVCYPLMMQMLFSYSQNKLKPAQLCECIDMIASFVVRRAACEIIRGPMNKLFIRFAGKYPARAFSVSFLR